MIQLPDVWLSIKGNEIEESVTCIFFIKQDAASKGSGIRSYVKQACNCEDYSQQVVVVKTVSSGFEKALLNETEGLKGNGAVMFQRGLFKDLQ